MKQAITKSLTRVALIAHPLHAGGGVSVGRNIISAFAQVAPNKRYIVSIPAGLNYEPICDMIPNCETLIFKHRSNLLKRWWWENMLLKPAVRRFKPDIVFALASKSLGGIECPEAILCHNPYLWYPPKYYGVYSIKEMLFLKIKTWLQCRLLRQDLSISCNFFLYQTMTAQKRIKAKYKPKASSVLCPNAISDFALMNDDKPPIPNSMQPHMGKFKLLFVTRYYPHKNLEILLKLFSDQRKYLEDCTLFLSIDRDQGPGAKRLLDSITQNKLDDRLVNVGPIPQERLGSWYRNCDALLMPTILESFSGTYLEAMHFGLPILTSDLDFSHEICDTAAMYFNPWDTASIRDTIIELRDKPELVKKLKQAGSNRLLSMKKNWCEIVRELLERFNSITSNKKGKIYFSNTDPF